MLRAGATRIATTAAVLKRCETLTTKAGNPVNSRQKRRENLDNVLLNRSKQNKGIAQFRRHPVLNDILGGFRPGEVTVLTGPTGAGKTTFVCEVAGDLIRQGIRTLFCSFEMDETAIERCMIVQNARKPLHELALHDQVDRELDQWFGNDRLTFMGSDEVHGKELADTAKLLLKKVQAYCVQHVIIDNVQFLVGMAGNANRRMTAFEKHDQQDYFVGLVRKMATDTGAHFTVIVHPHKEVPTYELTLRSIGGTPRVAQEADTVLIIQRPELSKTEKKNGDQQIKYLQVHKNRHAQTRVLDRSLIMDFNEHIYTHDIVKTEE